MRYTQNHEESFFESYFKGFKGTLLDLGANDGLTYSNSRKLIELGWEGVLVEASPVTFERLNDLYKESNIECINIAIGTQDKEVTFYESGSLVTSNDYSLVSTIDPKELERWPKTKFKEMKVECVTYNTLLKKCKIKTFDFISIDIEGLDYDVLTQIDLTDTNMVCVEHNGVETEKYVEYCESFGMRELHRNQENLIMVR